MSDLRTMALLYSDNQTNSVQLFAPKGMTTNNVITMPSADGTAGQILTTNGLGTWSFGSLSVAGGGTGLTTGNSGGVPYFNTATTMASSATLTASAIVLGGGAGAAPTSLALGTANQVLVMNGAGTANTYALASTANLDPQVVQYANVALTTLNLSAMSAAPVQILAAAGAGKYHQLLNASISATFGTAAMTNGGNIGLEYGSTAALAGTAFTGVVGATLLTTAASRIGLMGPPSAAESAATNYVNQVVSISNATAAFTVGASTTTARVNLSYAIVNQ